MLADPIMRFEPLSSVYAPNIPFKSYRAITPNNTINIHVSTQADPGEQIHGTWADSDIQASVELVSGLGLQAGYGMSYTKKRIWRFDGYQGIMEYEKFKHGPFAAIVYDDGTSLLQLGYTYSTAFDGQTHVPSIRASTLVLGSDTRVEIGYRRMMRSLRLDTSDKPPVLFSVDEQITSDHLSASIEQGFIPGINIRLDLEVVLDGGYLQDPYSMVTLWSHWPQVENMDKVPQSKPESLPDSRARFGAGISVKFAIPGLAAALETGISHGTGTWRVEHTSAHAGWEQRLGDRFSLDFSVGAYHQTRALFYRDDYQDGPVGALWTCNRDLSSYIAWWGRVGLNMYIYPSRGRLLGMFKELTLSLSSRLMKLNYNFEGLSSQNGFTRYSILADSASREGFAGGWQMGGWFSMSAGF